MDYEKEYGRYKKKVEDQQKEIAKLHEEVQGMKQVLKANEAIITAILMETVSVDTMPLFVEQETINTALRGGYRIMSERSERRDGSICHAMWYELPEETK